VVEPTPLKNISQNGNVPPNRGENKKYLKTPPSLTWNLKMMGFPKGISFFQWLIVRFHVKLQGCN